MVAVWIVRVASLAALCVSGWLSLLHAGAAMTAGGCGEAGCGAALGSRWAVVLGVPVAWLGVATHGGIFATSFARPVRREGLPSRSPAAHLLRALIALAALAGGWFTAVMIATGAWCPWCVTAHVLAWVMLGVVVVVTPLKRSLSTLAIAAAAVGLTIATPQLLVPPRPPAPLTPANFAGFTNLHPDTGPRLGPADADVLIAVLTDPLCPHCRTLHANLAAARQRYGDQLAVVIMPVPFNAGCNPHVTLTRPGFESSCGLVRLQLAAWLARPELAEAVDAAIAATVNPADTRAAVAAMIGDAELTDALANPRLGEILTRHANLFDFLGRAVPRLIVAGRAYPAPAEADTLYHMLETLTPLTAPRSTTP